VLAGVVLAALHGPLLSPPVTVTAATAWLRPLLLAVMAAGELVGAAKTGPLAE
jgi:hypothetical protein